MELRACYFCGSPGDGLDTYPVVPERIAPADGVENPADVVLCPDCRAKLTRVLDGVLGEADAAGGADPARDEPAAAGTGPTAATGGTDGTDPGGIPEITFDDAGDGSVAPEGTGSDGPAGGPTDAGADGDPGSNAGGESEAGPTAGTDPDDGSAGVDVVPDASSDADPPAEAAGDAGTASGDADDGDDGDAGASDTGSSRGLRGLGNSGAGEYRQALRLLRNRDFPIDRAEVVDVMSSAYDLNREECHGLIDLAVERGSLTDDDGVLRRD
ncbi:MAG: hypothetical protein ABEH40_03235 [Haloferacaceae archaeon]